MTLNRRAILGVLRTSLTTKLILITQELGLDMIGDSLGSYQVRLSLGLVIQSALIHQVWSHDVYVCFVLIYSTYHFTKVFPEPGNKVTLNN